jgi:hypothetical protein
MDGATLLDSLADWTAESHPNISVESRQQNNDLMGELRTELFTLLGSSSQVGGGNEDTSGISVVQPMDEELVRQLSPAELTYRISLAESGGLGMVGGGGDGAIIPYDFGQEGGDSKDEIGWLQKAKIMLGLRKFNQFIDEFEKLRAQINSNMAGYEVEVARGKEVTEKIVKTIRDMFLNKKYEAMLNIMIANEKELQTDQVKLNIMQRRKQSAAQEINRLSIVLEENVDEANKIFLIKGYFSGKYEEYKGSFIWKKSGFIVKIINEVNAQQKAYQELNKEYNYYAKEIERAKNLKALEAAVANKNVNELTRFQRKEIAEYQKNREKYEKMFAFSDTRRNEYEELMNKKEKIIDKLNFYKTTLTVGSVYTSKNKKEMQDTLYKWEKAITDVYKNISEAIEESGSYKKELNTLRELVANNGNTIDGLVAGMSEFEDIKKIYVKFLENAEKAYEIQEGVGNALKEVKANFIKLIPNSSLLPDMHRVVSAQSFVVSISQILANTQNDLGTNEQKGRDRLKDMVKKMKGGAVDTREEDDTYSIVLHGGKQTGGVYFDNIPAFPNHGTAFYEHANDGRVWSQTVAGPPAIAEGYIPATAPRTLVKILTLPYGVRKISVENEYINNVNDAIDQIANDKIIYIPVIDYKNLNYDARNGGYEYTLFTAICDSSTIRITGYQTKILPNQRDYCLIQGNYYVYNILEYTGNRRKDNDFINLFRTTCNGLRDMRLNNSDYIILPVFYKLGPARRTVDNSLFRYNEYVLLHPLLGGVMTATLTETQIATMRVPTPGNLLTDGYDFTAPAGIPRTLNLNIKLQPNTLNAAGLTDDYYYNFCGPDITIKQQPTAGNSYSTINHSPAGLPHGRGPAVAGDLQPNIETHMTTPANYASYANYMFQLTGHLNQFIDKLANIKLNLNTPPSINPLFANTQPYDIYPNYSFPYDLTIPTMARMNITDPPQIDHITKLDHLGTSKTWDDTYADNFFGEHDPAKLAVIFLPMKILIADLIYWMTNGTVALIDAKNKTGTALALYHSTYNAAATAAGIPASAIPTQGGPTAVPGGTLTPLNPRYNQRMDYLNKRLIPGSDYYTNLEAMDKIIKKFSSPEFQAYSEKLYKAYETMSIIRTYESKILDIKPAKDEFELPEFSLITAKLEPKVEPGSKDAYTNAGQKLYDKLKENKAYLAQNNYVASSDNLVRDLEDLLWQIGKLSNVAKDWSTVTFFSLPPGDKFVDILNNPAGATKLLTQLKADKKYTHDETIAKISYALQLILRLDPLGQAYSIYQNMGMAIKNQEKAFAKGKKGDKNKNKKGKTNRSN